MLTADKIAIQLIQVTKSVVLSNGLVFELRKTKAAGRLDINNTAINDTVSMTANTIDKKLIALSCYFMPRSFSESNQ